MTNNAFLLIIFSLLLSPYVSIANQPTWNKEITDDGIVVHYRITDTIINDEVFSLLHYKAQSKVSSSYKNCINVLKNAENYRSIFDYTKESKTIKTLGANEWLIYFYLDMPWPMSDSDAAYKMKLTQHNQSKSTCIEMISSPDMMPMQKVKRATIGHSKYLVEQIEKEHVRLSIETLSVPVSETPDWMVKAWFPEGPAKIIRRIEEMANTNIP